MNDLRCWQAVETAESYADGSASDEALRTARSAAVAASRELDLWTDRTRANATLSAVAVTAHPFAAAKQAAKLSKEAAKQAAKLSKEVASDSIYLVIRDVFGRPSGQSADRIAMPSGSRKVAELAATICNTHAFDRLPLLADALEDAGCTDAELLGHLRGPGPHVRGCWAVDLVQGKT
jgi:hypothetical protein